MDQPHLTRKTLLTRAKLDEDAWEEFTEIYHPFICHVLRQMNIRPQQFEDLVQEVILRIWQKLDQYDPEKGKFRTWMGTVVRNLVIDYLKSEKKHNQTISTEQETYLEESSPSEIDALIEREWKIALSKKAFENIESSFSGKAIDVFRLSLEGKETIDIANELSIQHASVKVLKSRVKRRYAEEIQNLIKEYETLT